MTKSTLENVQKFILTPYADYQRIIKHNPQIMPLSLLSNYDKIDSELLNEKTNFDEPSFIENRQRLAHFKGRVFGDADALPLNDVPEQRGTTETTIKNNVPLDEMMVHDEPTETTPDSQRQKSRKLLKKEELIDQLRAAPKRMFEINVDNSVSVRGRKIKNSKIGKIVDFLHAEKTAKLSKPPGTQAAISALSYLVRENAIPVDRLAKSIKLQKALESKSRLPIKRDDFYLFRSLPAQP